MSGEVEASRVRELERRYQHLADRAEAYAATVAEAPNLRGVAASLRGAADRAAAELEEARANMARAMRPTHIEAADARAGTFLWNRYGGQRGRFTAAADAWVMPDGTVEIDAVDGRTGRFSQGFRLDIDWHAADLAAQLADETEAREADAEAAVGAGREAGQRPAASRTARWPAMGDVTRIGWTDQTFNPWWGCARVSPGCVNCYADTWASRWGHDLWRRNGPRRMLSEAAWAKPRRWNREAQAAGRPARVFCASMADVFEDHPAVTGARARLWDLIEDTPWLAWQLLTKRPENVAGMAPWGANWPASVWLGTSVENQRYADERIPILAAVPARTRFLSCEPILGPVDLAPWLNAGQLGWVITGGESGSGRRDGRGMADLDRPAVPGRRGCSGLREAGQRPGAGPPEADPG